MRSKFVLRSIVILVCLAAPARGNGIPPALDFLRSSQAPDGSWGSGCSPAVETTAMAIRALCEAGLRGSMEVQRGLDNLAAMPLESVPNLALRALAFAAGGRENRADLQRLISLKIPPVTSAGGWSTSPGTTPDIISTSLALEALGTMPNPPADYAPFWSLISGYFPGVGETGVATTFRGTLYGGVRVGAAINTHRQRLPLHPYVASFAGLGFVGMARLRQDASGGYGDGPPTPLETAMVLFLIKSSRVELLASEEAAAAYLTGLQRADGSWDGDPLTTAWAVRALAIPVDTDADGISDAFEAAHELDARDHEDAARDPDADGLTNLAEYQAHSDPQKLDTDGDGVSDGDEIENHSDPADAGSKNRAPTFTSSPVTIAAAGALYGYNAAASDPDGGPITFRLAKGPTGLAVAEGIGRVSWAIAPGTTGIFQVALECIDARGAKGFQSYRLTVVPGGVDLSSGNIDLAGFRADTQTLIASGTVQVDIENAGTESFTGSFEVALFVDRNASGAFEPAADALAGSGSFSGTIPSLGSATIAIPASAGVAFRDAPLHAFIDSSRRIPESDETNNVGSSESASRHVGSLTASLPVVEWSWPGAGGGDVYCWMPPVVAPLMDTTADGVVDERDVPAVVFQTGVPNVAVQVRAHRGDTGETLWVFTDPALNDGSHKGPVIADLDADGAAEVLVHAHQTATLFAINADGTLKWKKPHDSYGTPLVVADLDADGFPEILSPGTTYDHEGNFLWTSPTLSGNHFATPLPVDLDLDGDLEVVYQDAAVDHEGQPVWVWRWNGSVHELIRDGNVIETRAPPPYVYLEKSAVIQADEDPEPEIVAIQQNVYLVNALPLFCFEPDGRVKWGPVPVRFAEPERGYAPKTSTPAVADFDGDGAPEVVVVITTPGDSSVSPRDPDKTAVLCFAADGTPRWRWESKSGDTYANASTSPSAYDFDGDGAFEVLVSTAHELVILSGSDGSPVWRMGAEIGTGFNGPIVADVDNDGGAEILRTLWPSYYYGTELRSGIVVIGDANDEWSNARRIWGGVRNDGVNLGETGKVPASHAPGGYDSGSTPRQLGLEGHTPHDVPDLTASRLRVDTSACPDVVLIARVGNGGSIHAPAGTPVEFWHGDPDAGGTLIGVALTEEPLYPGEQEDVRLAWPTALPQPAGGALVHAWALPRRARPRVHSSNLIPELKERGPAVYLNGTYNHYGWMVNGVYAMDGIETSAWYDQGVLSTAYAPHHFFEVHFTLPVDVESVTLKNPYHPTYGWKTANLTLYTDLGDDPVYEDVVTVDAAAATVDVPDTRGIRRIRFEGDDVRGETAAVGEIEVAGSFEEPIPRIHEGRADNNRASAFLRFACGGPQPNRAPQITSTPKVTASASESYSYKVTAEDPDGGAVAFTLVRGPAGMGVNAASGVLAWSPGFEHVGSHPVEVEARDAGGLTARQSFDLVVEARINRAPQITSQAPTTASGAAWSYQAAAIDPDGDPLAWFLAAGPESMAIDASTGLLSWSPAPGIAASVAIRVEDGRGGSARQSFTLTSGDATVDPPQQPVDKDGDGFSSISDCDDEQSGVNPGRIETPGDGMDNDCNPATPDEIGTLSVTSVLRASSRRYTRGQTAILVAQVFAGDGSVAYSPVAGDLSVRDALGRELFQETRTMGALLPRGVLEVSFEASTLDWPAGLITTTFTPRYANGSWTPAETQIEVVESESRLSGSLSGPREVSPGEPFTLRAVARNISPADLASVILKVKLYDALTLDAAGEWSLGPAAIPQEGEVRGDAVFGPLAAGAFLMGLSAETGGKTYVLATGRVDVLGRFRRGDSNSDGKTNISDAVRTLGYLFLGSTGVECLDSADADDNGKVQITDPIYTLNYLFLGGPPLPPPSDRCGGDFTKDDLGDCPYPGELCEE